MTLLGLYRDPIVARMTSASDWRIADLLGAERPVSLYLVVPPSDISRTRPLVRLILNQIGRRLAERYDAQHAEAGTRQLLFMLDEFPALGRLDFFESALAYLAAYRVRAFLVAQSLHQIDKAYGHNHSILDNCHVRVAFSLRVAAPQELFNVEHKPIADALSKLPATYEGMPPDKKPPAAKPTTPGLPKGVPAAGPGDWDDEADRAEKALLARMEAEARKSPVFFRLQLKAPPKESAATEVRPDPLLRPPPTPEISNGGLTALTTLRAAERALALASGDVDALGAGTTDQTRKPPSSNQVPRRTSTIPTPCRRRSRPTS
jgi:hypothetical protein